MSKDVITKTNEGVLNQYKPKIVEIFKKFLDDQRVQLYMFGSRAKGTAHNASDIDVAVKGENITPVQLSEIRDALHESDIPYKVELINFKSANKAFKQSIDNEGILIWEN